MSTLDALNKRLSMWKREKALRGNSRFDVDSAIEEIEDDIKKILNLGTEISELDQLRAALAQAQAERDAALEDVHSTRAQIENERNAQRAVWNELRVLFGCKPNESLVAVCNQTIAELATATRRAEQAEAVAARLRTLATEIENSAGINSAAYADMVRAALAGQEGGPLHGHGAPDADAQGDE